MKLSEKQQAESVYYETANGSFGLNFPAGISAKKLINKLKKAQGNVS